MPLGHTTRGTTGSNRLRRFDRWLATHPALRACAAPLIVDLGYGADGTTTFELGERIAPVRPGVRVLGLELDPQRVRVARAQLAQRDAACHARTAFARGGFEVPLPQLSGGAGPVIEREERPHIIRACNVLRQYDETEVSWAWRAMRSRLAPGGLLLEGTCDELGRVCSWFGLPAGQEAHAPLAGATFTISLRLRELASPLVVAERLPKALIHRNVPGEPIHAFLMALDGAWRHEAALAAFGTRQRFIATARRVQREGWPVLDNPRRWRLGELTIAADALRARW